MRHLVAVMPVAATPALAQDGSIADQQARLARATARLNVATCAGRDFTASRRTHVDLDQRVLGTWLAAIAPNGLRATATGLAAEGAVI